MSKETTIRGVCAAVLTPLNERFEPDAQKAIAYYRKLLNAGCTALNVLGTTGEALSLTAAQRLRFMEALASSDLPLQHMMVGTSAAALADTIELTRAGHSFGFGAALIMPPRTSSLPSEDGIVRYYESIAKTIGDARRFIYLYNFPKLSGFAFSASLVDRLMREFPDLVGGIKDSSNDVAYEKAVASAHRDLAVFPSSECHLLSAKRFGLAGCISGSVALWPERARAIWDGDDNAHAENAQRELCALRSDVERHNLLSAVRSLTSIAENDNGWDRVIPPVIPLPSSERKALSDLIAVSAAP